MRVRNPSNRELTLKNSKNSASGNVFYGQDALKGNRDPNKTPTYLMGGKIYGQPYTRSPNGDYSQSRSPF
jgi:hypothetical protein